MDIETLNRWLGSIAFAISISSAVWLWLTKPGRDIASTVAKMGSDVSTRLERVREDLKGHDRRIQAVEAEIKHLPTSDEFGELQVQVTRVEGDMKRIEEAVGSVSRVVNRIDDYLRENR